MAGQVDDHALNTDAGKWKDGLFLWRAADPPSSQFTWSGADNDATREDDPFLHAMTGLCQVLLSSNQFFYLH